jgi:hypothetical protein
MAKYFQRVEVNAWLLSTGEEQEAFAGLYTGSTWMVEGILHFRNVQGCLEPLRPGCYLIETFGGFRQMPADAFAMMYRSEE